MALTQEEILLRLGLDPSTFKTGINEAQMAVDKLGHHLETGLAKGLVFHPIVHSIQSALEKVTDWASREFGEMFWTAVMGGGGEFLAKSLERTRSTFREANEKRWAGEELKEKERQLGVLQEQIDSLERGHTSSTIEGLKDQLKLKHDELAHQQAIMEDLESRMRTSEEIVEQEFAVKKAELDLAKTTQEFLKLKRDEEEKHLEEVQKKNEQIAQIEKDRAQLMAKTAEVHRHEFERLMPSVHDLAGSGWFGPSSGLGAGFHAGPFAGVAQQIEALGERAKQAFIYGNPELAHNLINARNLRYDRLANMGVIPQREDKVAEAQIQTAALLKDIHDGVAKIRVRVPNMAILFFAVLLGLTA